MQRSIRFSSVYVYMGLLQAVVLVDTQNDDPINETKANRTVCTVVSDDQRTFGINDVQQSAGLKHAECHLHLSSANIAWNGII